MVFGVGPQEETIQIHDAKTGKQVFAVAGARGTPRIAFSPDGKLVAAVIPPDRPELFSHELRVWETATGRVKISFPGLGGQPAFSPDGRTLAATHEDGIVLMELATGLARHAFRHHGKVEAALAWRPDGQVLAAASPEAPIYLWDVTGTRSGMAQTWNADEDDRRWNAFISSRCGRCGRIQRKRLPCSGTAFHSMPTHESPFEPASCWS
jgi:WD40 repeat protein